MKPLYLTRTTPLRVLLEGPGLRVLAADATNRLVHDVLLIDNLTEVQIWNVQNAELGWLKRARNRQRHQDGGLARPGRVESIRLMELQGPVLACRFSALIRNLQVFLLDRV